MHRLNLTIDKILYEKTRAFSFLEKKSISQIIRESLQEYLSGHKEKQVKLLLDSEDKKEVEYILKNNDSVSEEDFISHITDYPIEADEPLCQEEKMWVETLETLLNDEEKLAYFAQKGVRRAEDFRTDKIIVEWKEMIDGVLEE